MSLAQAQAAMQPAYRDHEITAAGANATPEFRHSLETDPYRLVSIASGYGANRDDVARSLSLLAGLVGLVLVVACINVATLLLVRGASRAREMAVRAAIGAGRVRLFRQAITESVMLALLGGAIGVGVALTATMALSTTMSIGLVQLDARVASSVQSFALVPHGLAVALAAIATIVAGLALGIVPALRATRVPATNAFLGRRAAIGDARKSAHGGRLVVVQIALSVALLAVAGVVVRSVRELRSRDLGVDRSHLLLAWTVPAQRGHASTDYVGYVDRLTTQLSSIPGVVSVTATNHGLLEGTDAGGDSHLLTIDGEPARAGMQVLRDGVAASFFQTAGMRIVAGRDFTSADDTSHPPVAIMNETMAHFFFGNQSAIGRRLGTPKNPVEIIGVVRDAKHGSPKDPRGVWYVSYRQSPFLFRSMCVVVRTAGDPALIRPALARLFRSFDPALPVLRIDTVEEQLDDVLFRERLIAGVATVFSGLAALRACIGLYGVIAYGVARRTNEIGVRVALGATHSAVVSMVLRQSVTHAVAGVLLGIPLAVGIISLVSTRVYAIGRPEPMSLIGAAIAMLSVALVAGAIPAKRAARIDPATTLRAD